MILATFYGIEHLKYLANVDRNVVYIGGELYE